MRRACVLRYRRCGAAVCRLRSSAARTAATWASRRAARQPGRRACRLQPRCIACVRRQAMPATPGGARTTQEGGQLVQPLAQRGANLGGDLVLLLQLARRVQRVLPRRLRTVRDVVLGLQLHRLRGSGGVARQRAVGDTSKRGKLAEAWKRQMEGAGCAPWRRRRARPRQRGRSGRTFCRTLRGARASGVSNASHERCDGANTPLAAATASIAFFPVARATSPTSSPRVVAYAAAPAAATAVSGPRSTAPTVAPTAAAAPMVVTPPAARTACVPVDASPAPTCAACDMAAICAACACGSETAA